MENTGIISVIIPVYNSGATIHAALNSVGRQTGGKFEVIVINDGSTDNSLAAIYNFKKINAHLNIIVIDKLHEGASATRNIGLQLASGNYIAFLDADDEWHPEKTLKQLAILKGTPEADLVGCHFKPLSAQAIFSNHSHITSKDLLFKNFFQTSTVLMKRNVFDAVGFFERSFSHGEDRNYFLQASKTFSCVLVNETLITYGNGKRGFGQTGLSGNLMQMEMGELKNLVFAYRKLKLSFFVCCSAIIYSLAKFIRRIFIVYISDKLKRAASKRYDVII